MSVDSWEEQSYIEVLRGRILKAISVAGEGSKSVVSLILFPHHTWVMVGSELISAALPMRLTRGEQQEEAGLPDVTWALASVGVQDCSWDVGKL